MNNWKDIPYSEIEAINITEISLKLIYTFSALAKINK